ncbi:BglG family transcription antiterminator [Halobacillus hunanensis]|uniref:BglG family transcription antiterminator n=1 Tax=Halobacillus hunanensis TaxID=578214 RepID=UPI0009A8EE2D|nr:BglG family transcription antiterminator [Halobacillus hunanensis]
MNDRQRELVHTLILNTNEYTHVHALAESIHCSEKTVRNDLKRIEEFLKNYPGAILDRKPGVGIQLVVEAEEKSRMLDHLSQAESKSQEDRLIEITYQLLVSKKPVTLSELSSQYFTNKSTIKGDLNQIALWLERFDLELVSRQRLGHGVKGGELQKRNALARLPELATSQLSTSKEILNLFSSYEVNIVRKLLRDMQHHFSVFSVEGDYESLLIHTLVMIKRTTQRFQITLDESAEDTISHTEEYGISDWFLTRLERILRIVFPQEERIYFTRHLISSKSNSRSSKKDSNRLIEDMVEQLISRMGNFTMIDFYDDQILKDGLNTHLESTVYRLHYGFTIHNPMLDEIKKMYPYMFRMVVLALEEVGSAHELLIPEDEAAYVVLHFQASVERLQKQRNKAKKVLIVCDLGVGMSHLLQAKLEQTYRGFDIIDCVGMWEVEEVLAKQAVDLVISTKSLPHQSLPVIVVSPLLETKDKKRLDQFLKSIDQDSRAGQGSGAIERFVEDELIYLDVDLEHRFKVVELLANGLVTKGNVTQAFPHSALLRERSSATSIGGGIAIPHAHPEEVLHSTVAIAILQEPLEWGREYVSVVFLLAMTKQDRSLIKPLIQRIASMSASPEFIQNLKEARGVSSIRQILLK